MICACQPVHPVVVPLVVVPVVVEPVPVVVALTVDDHVPLVVVVVVSEPLVVLAVVVLVVDVVEVLATEPVVVPVPVVDPPVVVLVASVVPVPVVVLLVLVVVTTFSVMTIFLLDSVPVSRSLTVTVTLPAFLNLRALSIERVPFTSVCAVSGKVAFGSPSTRMITCLLYVVSTELSFLIAEMLIFVDVLMSTVSAAVMLNHLSVFTGALRQTPSLQPFGQVVWVVPIFCLLTH